MGNDLKPVSTVHFTLYTNVIIFYSAVALIIITTKEANIEHILMNHFQGGEEKNLLLMPP